MCSCVSPAEVLYPFLQPLAQERHRPARMPPEEGLKNNWKNETTLSEREVERVGAALPGKSSVTSLFWPLHISKGYTNKMETDFLVPPTVTGQRTMVLDLKLADLD